MEKKKWSTVKIIAAVILAIVAIAAIVTGLGTFDWMERVFDPNNVR